jgi:hypothetical protein
MGLEPEPVTLAANGLLLAVVWPAVTVYQNLYQGVLVYSGRTQGITQAVVVSLAVSAVLLTIGALLGTVPGIYMATAAFVAGSFVQVGWLAARSRPVLRELQQGGGALAPQGAD